MVVAIAAGAVLESPAASAVGTRQIARITYTSVLPGTPTGLVLDVRFLNPENASRKPHTAATMVVHAPAGAVIDTTVPPQCHASDAQLMVQGPSACPPATKIGSGAAVSDSGGGGPFPRYTHATITNFNNQDEVIGASEVKEIPALKPVDRTKIRGTTSTTNFPLFPGMPPPDSYTPFKSLYVVFPRYIRHGRAYTRTPPTCPAAGFWTITAEFTYVDGVTQSVASHSRCRRKKHRHDDPWQARAA